jgi:CRISP-associated protein Cas1
MTDRIIELSAKPARLRVEHAQLVVEQRDCDPATLPLEEIAVIVAGHRQITYTQAVLAGIMQAGGSFVACDANSEPVGLMLPLNGHHLQGARFAKQAEATLPTKKRLWQQVVRSKITGQAEALKCERGDDAGLPALIPKVKSGDPTNVEAQASQRYWKRIFGDESFRRNRDADDQNRFLNYGYNVMRALVGRAICAAGLHPGLGLHHHGQYDPFPLASDLMEPFRPIVDRAVVDCLRQHKASDPLNTEVKRALLQPIFGRVHFDGDTRTLFDAASRTASSLVQVFEGKRESLALPEW